MEYVPLEFCQSVVSLLSIEDYHMKERFASAAWQNEINALFMDRINVNYYIGYNGGDWSYFIWISTSNNRCGTISLAELQNLNRRNLRIRRAELRCATLQYRASSADIIELVKFALPFVNMAHLRVRGTIQFPQNDVLHILSLHCNSSIMALSVSRCSQETWAVLSVHLKSDCLKKLEICKQQMYPEMKTALKEYLLHSRFSYFSCDSPALMDKDMRQHLFSKPQTEPRWSLKCKSSLDPEELRNFGKNLQISSSNNEIKWKRRDGRVVKMTHNANEHLPWIQFS